MHQKIKIFIKDTLLTILISLLICGQISLAQVATPIPQPLTQFFDANGNPLTSGTVKTYIPNTSTLSNTWQDVNESVLNANPVVLDAAGRAKIFGNGSYRFEVKDSLGNLIYDYVTNASNPGGATIVTGDGDLVGTIKPWAGLVAPNQYAFTYGQAVSRTTFSALLTAITLTINVNCTSGSPTLTGISDTSQIPNGAAVEASCVAPGATVLSKTGSSVTLTSNALSTTSLSAVFFPYGNGDGSTTFNLPDLRGNVIAGRTNMGGVASSNLTSSFYITNPQAIGARGGNQSQTLTASNLPSITTTLNDPGHTHSLNNATNIITGAGSGPLQGGVNGLPVTITVNSNTTGITNNHIGGSGAALSAVLISGGSGYTNGAQVLTISGGTCSIAPQFNVTVAGNIVTTINSVATAGNCSIPPTMPASVTGGGGTGAKLDVSFTAQAITTIQPTITLNYIIKVTPDTSAIIASGVSSLGGMTGAIACGVGLLCTGNIISSTSTALAHGDIFVGNVSNQAVDFGSLATFSDNGTLNLNPTPLSISPGIIITQSGINSGSQTGTSDVCRSQGQPSYSYNSICLTSEALNVSTGSPPNTYAFSVGMTTGGTNSQGTKVALGVEINHNVASAQSPERDHIGLVTFGIDSASHGGTGTGLATAKGTMFGFNSVAHLLSGATNLFTVSGAEIDVGIEAGASSRHRLGWSVVAGGSVIGDTATGGLDAAYEIASTAAPWDKGVIFSSLHGGAPVRAAGTLIGTDAVGITVTNFIDFSTYACTGNQFKGASSNFLVDCSGNITGRTVALSAATGVNLAVMSDGTVTTTFTPSTDFTHSFEISTITNHNLVFRTNSTIGGYFDTSQQFNIGSTGITQGVLNINGLTSGTVGVKVQAAAGTYNFNLPTTAGSSGQILTSAGGGGSPMTWDNTSSHLTAGTGISLSGTTNVTVSIDQSFSPTWTGQHTHNVARTITSAAGAAIDDVKIQNATTTLTGSTTVTRLSKMSVYQPTITDASAVTVSNASTFYVEGPPIAAGSTTITTNWAILTGSGNIGIGPATIPATSLLSASGPAMYFGGSGANDGYIQISDHTNAGHIEFVTNATNSFIAYNNILQIFRTTVGVTLQASGTGGVSIGSTTDPGAGGLFVNGATITFNGLTTDAAHVDRTVCQDTTSKSLFFGSGAAGICVGTSSVRFKHDIKPLDLGLNEIVKLQAVSYKLNADYGDANKVLYGFTAEQGETILPQLVGKDKDGKPQTFDYMGVVPVLVRAVQQLKADNDNLHAEINQLKSRRLQ